MLNSAPVKKYLTISAALKRTIVPMSQGINFFINPGSLRPATIITIQIPTKAIIQIALSHVAVRRLTSVWAHSSNLPILPCFCAKAETHTKKIIHKIKTIFFFCIKCSLKRFFWPVFKAFKNF